MFETAKTIAKTNRDMPKLMRKYYVVFTVSNIVSNEDKKTAWKSYYQKLLRKIFAWDRNRLPPVDTVSGAPRQSRTKLENHSVG